MLDVQSFQESLCHQHDLTNEPEVWYTHGTWSEENFQVLWKLCTSSIARVHRNEVSNSRVHWYFLSHEVKQLLLIGYCILNAFHLNSNDRKNLHSDSVKLIKTSPGSGLCKTFENIATRFVIHLLRTIENIHHHSNSSSKIFCGFCLA